MKKKFISIETLVSASGDRDFSQRVDVLCRDYATVDELMAILQLCPVGGTVSISVNEEELPSSPFGGFTKEKDA